MNGVRTTLWTTYPEAFGRFGLLRVDVYAASILGIQDGPGPAVCETNTSKVLQKKISIGSLRKFSVLRLQVATGIFV